MANGGSEVHLLSQAIDCKRRFCCSQFAVGVDADGEDVAVVVDVGFAAVAAEA